MIPRRLRTVCRLVRLWWRTRRGVKPAAVSARDQHQQQRARLLRPVPPLQVQLAVVAIEGGHIGLVPNGSVVEGEEYAVVSPVAAALTDLLLRHGAVPNRLTPRDLGLDHLVVAVNGRHHVPHRWLLRGDDNLLPLLGRTLVSV